MFNNISRKAAKSDAQFADFISSGRNGASSFQSLGTVLRERREAMAVTLAEVEAATRIRQKYLSALEADEWHLLPGEVVGRGFLRNYTEYLGLDPTESIERRRAVADTNLSAALSTTSAGSALPPEREVDYRPKEVDLKDDEDGIQRGEIQLTPIFAILAVAAVVALVWWGIATFSAPLSEMVAGLQDSVSELLTPEQLQPVATDVAIGIVNPVNADGVGSSQPEAPANDVPEPSTTTDLPNSGGVLSGGQNNGEGGSNSGVGTTDSSGGGATPVPPPANNDGTSNNVVALLPTPTPTTDEAALPTPEPPAPEPPTPEPPTPEPPTPEPPTPEPPTPEPPTPEPEVIEPTEEPAPAAAPIVAASACGDGRSMISNPGNGQTVGGVVNVSGNATHESFQYYKLEYAMGAAAGGGFVYFDGGNAQVSGGLLGNLESRALPNGEYTLRLTVVDQTGNFPPPCDVSIAIQN